MQPLGYPPHYLQVGQFSYIILPPPAPPPSPPIATPLPVKNPTG